MDGPEFERLVACFAGVERGVGERGEGGRVLGRALRVGVEPGPADGGLVPAHLAPEQTNKLLWRRPLLVPFLFLVESAY